MLDREMFFEHMTAKERNELEDPDFALVYMENDKKIRKYPIHKEKYVKSASHLFPKGVPEKYLESTARAILRAAKSYGMDTSGWDSLNKYADKHVEEAYTDLPPLEILQRLYLFWKECEYGIPKNNKIVDPDDVDFNKEWKLLSPDNFEKYKGGVCWDYVEYGEKYLKEHGFKCKKYFMSTNLPDNMTHTFLIADIGDDEALYYVEGAFKDVANNLKGPLMCNCGGNYEKAVHMVIDEMSKVLKDKFSYYVWEYKGHPPYGCNSETFTKYTTKGEPIIEGEVKNNKPPRTNSVYLKGGNINKVKNYEFDKVYFGSPHAISNPMKLEGPLFVSPYPGIASIFAVRPQDLSVYGVPRGVRANRNFDEWNKKDGAHILKELHMYIETNPEIPIKPVTEMRNGYVYEINLTKELKDHLYRSERMHPEFEICIDKIDSVKFAKKTKVEIKTHISGRLLHIKESYGPNDDDTTGTSDFDDSFEDEEFFDESFYFVTSDTIQETFMDEYKAPNKIYYRFTYMGEGIYEALKKVLYRKTKSDLAWKNFLKSNACSWLPKPPKYGDDMESYFTEKGKKEFIIKTYPFITKHIHEPDIEISKLEIDPKDIVYSDTYQVVVSKDSSIVKDVKLKTATKSDLDQICEWQMETMDEKYHTKKYFDMFRKENEENLLSIKIISYDKKDIGMYQAYSIDEGEWWYIAEIYIIPEYRGHGIGSYLIKKDIDKHDNLVLRVDPDNKRAIKLYKSLGFVTTKREDGSNIMRLEKKHVQEGASSMKLFKQLPKDLQKYLEKGNFSDIDEGIEIDGYIMYDISGPSDLDIAGDAYDLKKDDPFYDAIDFASDGSGNDFVYNPDDGYYYILDHEVYDEYGHIHGDKLSSNKWSELIKKPHTSKNKEFESTRKIKFRNICEDSTYSKLCLFVLSENITNTMCSYIVDDFKHDTFVNKVLDFANQYNFKSIFNAITDINQFIKTDFKPKLFIRNKYNIDGLKTRSIKFINAMLSEAKKAGIDTSVCNSNTIKLHKQFIEKFGVKHVQEGAWNDIKRGVNPYSKKLFFHLSYDPSLDEKELKPQIPAWLKELKDPEKTMKETGRYENYITPRVCLSPSIEGCLVAIMNTWKLGQSYIPGKQVYVYVPEKPITEYKHKTNKEIIKDGDIFDAIETKEMWILEPVKLKRYGSIIIDEVKDNGRRHPVIDKNGKKKKDDHIGRMDFKWHWFMHPSIQKEHEKYEKLERDNKNKE